MLQRSRFETSDRDEAIAAMTDLAGGSFTLGGSGPVALKQAFIRSDVVTVGRMDFSAAWTAVNDPIDAIVVSSVQGTYVADVRGQQHVVTQGHVVRPPTHLPVRFHVPSGPVSMTRIPGPAVRDIVREVFLEGPSALDLLNGVRPVSPAMERLWVQTMGYYREQLLQDDVYDYVLVREQATRTLIVTTLMAFGLHREQEHAAFESAAIRRARTYIDEHLRDAVTVHDVAVAARLSPSALQKAFLRAYDITPMAYLRRARLDAARRDLLAADPTAGGTVEVIARRWGFAHLGRFASYYRHAFGELPSATLRD